MYNPEFFLKAYGKIGAKPGNMTPGSDGKTIDGMSLKKIDTLIEKLKDESYQPHPSRREYITKKDGVSKRPLGIPFFEDKLVQEVVRDILSNIYEKTFSESSHGFRPERSCHTAIQEIVRTFRGTKWFIEGDIKGFFDNIDHHVLIKLLRKRIEDEKFIRLIWKFLKAGYLEDWIYHKSYSGTPQGGIVSPILANIYLHELDQFMTRYIKKFNKGEERRANSEYYEIRKKLNLANYHFKKNKSTMTEEERKNEIEKIQSLQKRSKTLPSMDEMDKNFKRIKYVRYADDFLIGVIGSNKDALKIKNDIAKFLKDELKLDLSLGKTLITHSSNPARFLGYDISIYRLKDRAAVGDNKKIRNMNQSVYLTLPKEVWVKKLQDYRALKIHADGEWEAVSRTELIHLDDLEILSLYNAEIRGIYNYYRLANNVSVLNKFFYIMEYSLYKTFARKYDTSMKKIMNKYRENKTFAVKYQTKQGECISYLYHEGFSRKKTSFAKDPQIDQTPNGMRFATRGSMVDRLLAGKCEWCETPDVFVEMHHVKKLKDLKGKKRWEKLMIARNRKTLALCEKCHDDLHAGRLD